MAFGREITYPKPFNFLKMGNMLRMALGLYERHSEPDEHFHARPVQLSYDRDLDAAYIDRCTRMSSIKFDNAASSRLRPFILFE